MHLTLTFRISDAKNDDGQGKQRRHHQDKIAKQRTTICRLSSQKITDLFEVGSSFSRAWEEVVRWGLSEWDRISFTFPLVKDGQPILDKEGKQKVGLISAHYLANWLSVRVRVSNSVLHSRLVNGVRNQAAETLLSQYKLRQMEEIQPRRLTGKVGEVKELETRSIPILFPGTDDFRLFKHIETGKVFVCLPLFSREKGKTRLPPGVIMRNGKPFRLPNRLVPLREGEDIVVPNSSQWEIFSLDHQRELSGQRNAEEMLADLEIQPRTAELRFKNGSWYFNIVVNVPEPAPIKAETYLGIHIGYYAIFWTLIDQGGKILKEGQIDQGHLKNLVLESARQRSYAQARLRYDRLPRYRGVLKLERERAARALIALAKEHRAAIGVEDVSGVDKSTWFGKANLLRSHWDFGKDVDVLTYMSVLAGLPLVRRGKKKELFKVFSFRALFTCSACGFTNSGKPKEERLVALEDGRIYCGNCESRGDTDRNAAKVMATETRNFFTRIRK